MSELAEGLEARGVESGLAMEVAQQMTDHDALDAHAREELGMHGLAGDANALQAAWASSVSFALGAAMPLVGALLAPQGMTVGVVAVVALLALVILGGTGARLGGAPVRPSILRVVIWGSLAMLVTSGVGRMFGVHV